MLARPPARFACLGLALALPGAALALSPGRPSDLVTLVTTGATDPACPAGGTPFATRILPDGTQASFTIPPKRVLIVTSVDYEVASPEAAGRVVYFALTLQGIGDPIGILLGHATTDGVGTGGTVEATAGVPVKPGRVLCGIGGTYRQALLHGFLAKDK